MSPKEVGVLNEARQTGEVCYSLFLKKPYKWNRKLAFEAFDKLRKKGLLELVRTEAHNKTVYRLTVEGEKLAQRLKAVGQGLVDVKGLIPKELVDEPIKTMTIENLGGYGGKPIEWRAGEPTPGVVSAILPPGARIELIGSSSVVRSLQPGSTVIYIGSYSFSEHNMRVHVGSPGYTFQSKTH